MMDDSILMMWNALYGSGRCCVVGSEASFVVRSTSHLPVPGSTARHTRRSWTGDVVGSTINRCRRSWSVREGRSKY